jgi:hypothetical protein
MTPYQETLLALAAESESAALELWWRVGELGDELFRAALTAILATYNQRAISLAVTAFSLQASAATGVAVPTELPALVDDAPRLTKAANTVLDVARASNVPDDIIARLGRAEPLNTAARTYSGQLAESPLVEGWVRNMDADPCQLCKWWWREGRIWPKQHPFQTHTGCACVPRPVWAKNIKSTGYTRQLRETA